MNNPLLTVFDSAPFSKINASHFLPAFQNAIELAKNEIDHICKAKEQPSFKNTIEALDYSGDLLSRVSSIFFNLNSAETNDEIQKIAQEVSPILSEFRNDVTLNQILFQKVKQVYDTKESFNLTKEQQQLLEKHYKSFTRNGALLDSEDKEKLRSIDKDLAQKTLQFGQNLLADTNDFELLITNESDLKGLPEGTKEAAKSLAESKQKKGWLITLDYPSYIPFMQYADNRDLRKKLAIAFGAKSFKNNKFNNEKLIKEIVHLRLSRAQLLGYDTHAHFTLEERMAQTASNVYDFSNDLLKKATPAAKREFENLSKFAKELDGIDQLQKWDSAYYSEKLKQKLYSLDDETLKPYFKLNNVLNGAFTIAGKLFDLTFKKNTTADTYNDEVTVYDVHNSKGDFIALFYTDFHPRPGKRAGAWMTSYKSQQLKNNINHRPHVSIVCNFTRPTNTKPSLLTFNEVTTLFHEFGHALHGMLANTTYPSLSGTSVFWDFVELPSQIMENWCFEKEALEIFAHHYETGDLIPMEYIDKIKESATFHEGMATLRQLSFGLLDMAWHTNPPTGDFSVKSFEAEAFKNTQLYPDVSENCMSTSFAHIFQGGYSSGYYSYKWAEVLDADAFSCFKEKGIFNPEVAKKFKTEILEKGGTEHPAKLYENFRGQKPTNEALLKRAGLA
ncbi:M3 family metallopeptidase [Aquimarina agarilytica]|uniref:M3 family metallopeptidase n=1 Tax=Aquimarina agarilytica TaxID=1087449 RepID=UPI0002895985|nr:M3 family metallopeptidase [Aquimarina agarilytica]